MINKIHSDLLALQDEKYRDFSKTLVRTSYPVIGIRLPVLRAYADTLLKEDSSPVFMNASYEEVLIHGIYIAKKKMPFAQKIKEIEDYLPLIDSWGICDSFVSSIKEIKKHKEEYFPYLLKYLSSHEEFIQRYAFVVLLNYYVEERWYEKLIQIIKEEQYQGYYSQMASAWLLSYLFMKFFDQTLSFVKEEEIDPFVLKKGIRKALDSYRLNKEQKMLLRRL